MIDQLPTPVPQAAQSAKTASRDRQQIVADKDDQARSFEDIVSKAGQQQSQQDQGKDAEIELRPQAEAEARRPADSSSKVTFDLSAALRGFATAPQAQNLAQNLGQMQGQTLPQVQINLHAQLKLTAKDIARVANGAQQAGAQADAALAKLVDTLKDAAHKAEKLAEKIQHIAVDVQADAEQGLTPSDELGLLLGLTQEADVRHGRKAEDADKAETADEDDKDSHAGKVVAKTDTARADHVAAAADVGHARDNPAADEKSSQNDVVRLVNAHGRGRSVDIEVPSVHGETQRDGAKTASSAKVETATVLEARRYLGFSPEPNAAALTTAIKADPTWTEALQAAQGPDRGTLGNTVTEVNTLKLQMNPENLGNMVASLKLKGEELTVELRVDSIEAYQQLSADQDDIVKALQDQGFTIDKVTVQLNATDRTDPGADRNMARQDQPQRDGQAQQRDGQNGQSGRNENQRDQRRWTSPGTLADGTPVDIRTDAGRPDDIYL